jgi:hypothetical protein
MTLGTVLLLVVAFAFTRGNQPAVDYSANELVGDPVKLTFRLHRASSGAVELALTEGLEEALKPDRTTRMFMQFGVAVNGGVTVTLNGISEVSDLDATGSRPDWPKFPFMEALDGSRVSYFTFNNQLGEDPSGNQLLLMTYVGPAVPLVETLVIAAPITLPSFISQKLGIEGLLQFQPGKLALDGDANGFWIPVEILAPN